MKRLLLYLWLALEFQLIFFGTACIFDRIVSEPQDFYTRLLRLVLCFGLASFVLVMHFHPASQLRLQLPSKNRKAESASS